MLNFIFFFNNKIMTIISSLFPRKEILIGNKYSILNNYDYDFHLVIYYISEEKCKLIIRRLDNEKGWGENIDIKIEDIDNKKNSLIYSIGSSQYSTKIINLYSFILLIKNKEHFKKQIIPKKIIQTYAQNNIQDVLLSYSIYTFQELNPEYEYVFFNNQECRKFIQNKYDKEILYFYDILVPGAFKADFFRYCYLYKEGGCYFDCKQLLRIPLSRIIKDNDTLILCQDNHKTGLFNAFMCSESNNSLFLHIIQKIIFKINNFSNIYGSMKNDEYESVPKILSLTGPTLLYDIFNEQKLSYEKYVKCNHIISSKGSSRDHSNYKKFYISYQGKHIITKNYPGCKIFGTHYSKLWKKHQIFYHNKYKIDDYYLFTYPNQCSNNIEYYLLEHNKILINNYKKKNIFDNNELYKIHIINNKDNDTHLINFKYSEPNFMLIDTNISFNITNYVNNFESNVIYNNWDEEKKLINIHIIKNNGFYYLLIFFHKNIIDYSFQELDLIIYLKNKKQLNKKIKINNELIIEKIINTHENNMLNIL